MYTYICVYVYVSICIVFVFVFVYVLFDIINPFLAVVGRLLALLVALCFIFDLTAALLLGYFAFWPSFYYY